MQETCELCRGLRGHERLKQSLSDPLRKELALAREEVIQLRLLFKDMCWFYFEVAGSTWKGPWRGFGYESHPYRLVALGSREIDTWNSTLRVRRKEVYFGTVEQAPILPPDLIFKEVLSAEKALKDLEEAIKAPWDWAPGGDAYDKHVRESDGARLYSELRQNNGAIKKVDAR